MNQERVYRDKAGIDILVSSSRSLLFEIAVKLAFNLVDETTVSHADMLVRNFGQLERYRKLHAPYVDLKIEHLRELAEHLFPQRIYNQIVKKSEVIYLPETLQGNAE